MQEIDLNYYKSWRELDAIKDSGTPYEFVGEGKIVTFDDEADHMKWLELMYDNKPSTPADNEKCECKHECKHECSHEKEKMNVEDILAGLTL